MPSPVNASQDSMLTYSTPQRACSDLPAQPAGTKPTIRAAATVPAMTALPVLATAAWVMVTVLTGGTSLSPGNLMAALLIAIAVVSADILTADESELQLLVQALYPELFACQMQLPDLPPTETSAAAIRNGPRE